MAPTFPVIPRTILLDSERFVLVGAPKKTKKVKFPKLQKKKDKGTKSPAKKPGASEAAQKEARKQKRLQEYAALLKKKRLTKDDQEFIEDIEKMYRDETKKIRSQLPKIDQDLDDFEKGFDDEDEAGDDDEDEDDEDEDEEPVKSKPPVKKAPAKEEKAKPKKVKKSKGGNKTKEEKLRKLQEEEEKANAEPSAGKLKDDAAKLIRSLKRQDADSEESEDDDDDDEDLSPRERKEKRQEEMAELNPEPLTKDQANTKARSMFDEILKSDDDDDEEDEDLTQAERDERKKLRQEIRKNHLVKKVEVGLSNEEIGEREHLQKLKESLGDLSPDDARRLKRLNDKSSFQYLHYDDFSNEDKKQAKEDFANSYSNRLMERDEEKMREHRKNQALARRVSTNSASPEDVKELNELARKNPSFAKSLLRSNGVKLSIPDDPSHPVAWKHLVKKTRVDKKSAPGVIRLYHELHEKSSKGDFDSQQKLKELQSLLDDPQNLDPDARGALHDEGIKTSWNPEPKSKNFKPRHDEVVKSMREEEDKAKSDAAEAERVKKWEKVKDEKGKDKKVPAPEKPKLSDDDVSKLIEKHKTLSQRGTPKSKKDLRKIQRRFENLDNLSLKSRDLLDKAGIPTKWNPKPSGPDKEAPKKAPEPEKKEPTSTEQKTPKEDEGSYTSVEEYHKQVGKCPPGYRYDGKRCVVREDAKKEEIWQPRKAPAKEKTEESGTTPEQSIEKGRNVSSAMTRFDDLSGPSQSKVLDHTTSGVDDLTSHLHQEKSPEKRKGLLNSLKRVCSAIRPKLRSIFSFHKDKAKKIGDSIGRAHHVLVLNKDPKDWVSKEEGMNSKTVDGLLEGIEKL